MIGNIDEVFGKNPRLIEVHKIIDLAVLLAWYLAVLSLFQTGFVDKPTVFQDGTVSEWNSSHKSCNSIIFSLSGNVWPLERNLSLTPLV